jgi:hypothetical protein
VKTRVVNIRNEPCDVYCGRPSMWGNRFRIGPDGDRATVIAKYRTWILTRPALLALLPLVQGKVLGCNCAPLPCHVDVIAELADERAAA